MTSDGVTATMTRDRLSMGGATGMIAYNVGSGPVGVAPANTVAPAVTGTPDVGQVLSCSTGTWTGTPTPTYTYQWQRNGTNISGQTANTYTIQSGDEGTSIRCRVTGTNATGSATANSNAVTITGGGPAKLSIAEENALTPGITGPEMVISGAGDTSSLGFCREFSLNVGETAHFAVDGTAVEIDIVRVGWYGGTGYRLVETIVNTPTEQGNPTTISDSNSGVTCTGWSNTASWAIPDNATPGYYIGVVRSNPGPNASFMPFIVRDDDRPADIMIKSSDTTWALAYNYYGTPASPLTGKSLYGSGGPMGDITTRAHVATYHKPIITRNGVPQTYWMYGEFPLIRYMERMGFDVTYSASKDWREGASAPTLADCKIYISIGHDEYWSQGMRDKWNSLRFAGKHLIFMSGNQNFWRTRFPSDQGDVMWCFKDTMDGPGAHTGGNALDPVSWTGTWKDTRAANNATRDPEWNLTGMDFRMNGILYRPMTIAAGSPASETPFWRNTNVAASGLNVSAVVGMEADEMRPQRPVGQYAVLAATVQNIDDNRADDNGQNYNLDGNLNWGILFQLYGTAAVVGFGSCTWAWGLDNSHDSTSGGSTTAANSQQQQAIYNLMRDLGADVPETPISGLIAPTPVALSAYVGGVIRTARFRRLHDGVWEILDFTT